MIRVDPMPDELAIGHEGRLAWVNLCDSARETSALFQQTLIQHGREAVAQPRLHQLALLSGIAPTLYAQEHSMLPVLRVAAKDGFAISHGEDAAASFSRYFGMRTQRRGAFCCLQCIEEDLELEHSKVSWYRRTHHLIGVDWCHLHGCLLSQVEASDPFTRTPHFWMTESKIKPIHSSEGHLPRSGFLRRYVDIASAFLQRDKPYKVEVLNRCIANRASSLRMRTGRVGRRPLISDRLFESAPRKWLSLHINDYDKKNEFEHFQPIDAVASRINEVCSGETYALAIATLYESAEDALLDILSASAQLELAKPAKQRTNPAPEFWHGEIWNHYLESEGNVTRMSAQLGVSRFLVGAKLSELGLPVLPKHSETSPVWKAFMRHSNGESFLDACSAENIPHADLDCLLRKCSSRVFTGVKTIQKSARQQGNVGPTDA